MLFSDHHICIKGLPYFNLLKREGREKGSELGREQFAKMQRESLENYLIGLIKAVVGGMSKNQVNRNLEFGACRCSGLRQTDYAAGLKYLLCPLL